MSFHGCGGKECNNIRAQMQIRVGLGVAGVPGKTKNKLCLYYASAPQDAGDIILLGCLSIHPSVRQFSPDLVIKI